MGGIPVDRSKPGGIIQDALNQIKDLEGALMLCHQREQDQK